MCHITSRYDAPFSFLCHLILGVGEPAILFALVTLLLGVSTPGQSLQRLTNPVNAEQRSGEE